MRLLVYTVLRLVIVLAAAGALYLLGMRSWLLWVIAIVVGALVSYLVLRPQGRAAAEVIAEYSPLRQERPKFSPTVEADAAYEDAAVDERPGAADADEAPSAPASAGSLEREPDAEQHPVAELEEPRVPQDDDEVPAGRAPQDDAREAHDPREKDEYQQRPR